MLITQCLLLCANERIVANEDSTEYATIRVYKTLVSEGFFLMLL